MIGFRHGVWEYFSGVASMRCALPSVDGGTSWEDLYLAVEEAILRSGRFMKKVY